MKKLPTPDGWRQWCYEGLFANLLCAEVCEQEASRLIIAVRSVILRLDVVRVLQVARQRSERRQVRAVTEDVSGCGLVRVREEVELVLLGLRHEVTTRRARSCSGGARGTSARSRAGHAQPVCALLTAADCSPPPATI